MKRVEASSRDEEDHMEADRKDLLKKMFDNPPPKPGLPDETKFPRIVSAKIPCSQEELEEHLNK